ncbi:hypothetical protein BKD09_14820 [Bradyrhizobium japonicum]|uniref:Uncharacterized protein n=1 Tax=Bradyrhizobium japonicum TaxID=375 RepID=A0A1L3F8J5_BRAJP|nr:hypothetical protein BKD09_14820 [Bradyrhizobium japonicum]
MVPQTQRMSVLRISLSSFSLRARLAAIAARQSRSWRHSAKALWVMFGCRSDHAAPKASRAASKVAAMPLGHVPGSMPG